MRALALALALAVVADGAGAQEPAENAEPAIRFAARPDPSDFARVYPQAALEQEIEGRAVLDCFATDGGKFACGLLSEEPPGWGFGSAALQLSPTFRYEPVGAYTMEGVRGARIRIPIAFQIADEPPPR